MTTAAFPFEDRRAPLRWGGCLLLVAALHAGVGWLVLTRVTIPPLETPPEAVMLELPPMPAESAPAPEPAAPAPPEAQPTPLTQPPLAEPPPPQVQPPPPLPLEPPPLPTPVEPTPVELAPTPLPDPTIPLPPEPPLAVPVPVPLPPPPRPAPRPPPPRPVARPVQAARPIETPPPAAQAAPAPAAAPVASTAPPQPPSNAVPTWRGELIARLQRAKRYPEAARFRGDQGVATVSFTMDRSGHVLSAALIHGAGSAALDEEAVAMIHRAEPLPAMPPELPGNSITLTVPLTFSLR